MVRRYIQEANLFKNNALNKIKIWLTFLIITCCQTLNEEMLDKFSEIKLLMLKAGLFIKSL
jgi:hypothetical protein